MKFVVHKYRGDEFCWTLYAANGKKQGWMGEGHKRKGYVLKKVRDIMLFASKAKLEVIDGYPK